MIHSVLFPATSFYLFFFSALLCPLISLTHHNYVFSPDEINWNTFSRCRLWHFFTTPPRSSWQRPLGSHLAPFFLSPRRQGWTFLSNPDTWTQESRVRHLCPQAASVESKIVGGKFASVMVHASLSYRQPLHREGQQLLHSIQVC